VGCSVTLAGGGPFGEGEKKTSHFFWLAWFGRYLQVWFSDLGGRRGPASQVKKQTEANFHRRDRDQKKVQKRPENTALSKGKNVTGVLIGRGGAGRKTLSKEPDVRSKLG